MSRHRRQAILGHMHHSMSGWSWVSMSVAGLFWVVFLAPVVYLAVRLALHHGRRS